MRRLTHFPVEVRDDGSVVLTLGLLDPKEIIEISLPADVAMNMSRHLLIGGLDAQEVVDA